MSGTHRLRRARETVETVVLVLVHSNVFVSLGATGVAITATRFVDRPLEPLPLFVVFAVTLFVYSLDRVTDVEADAENLPGRAAFARRFGRPLLVAGAILYLHAVILAVLGGVPGAEFLVLPLAVAVTYSVVRAKRVLLLKNLVVGAAWGVIPLGVGVYYGVLWTTEILFLAGFFSVSLTVAAAVFDVKDLVGDRRKGVRTLPIVIGPQTTRRAAFAVILLLGVTPGLGVAVGALPPDAFLLYGYLGYVLAYIPFATPDRGPLFYGFVIDGEHVFLAILVLLTDVLSLSV